MGNFPQVVNRTLVHCTIGSVLSACAITPGNGSSHYASTRQTQVLHSDYQTLRSELSHTIADLVGDGTFPGLSLALVDDTELVWAEGFGYADRDHAIPATSETIYRAGSIAKPLTAMAVMQLEQEGTVDIDQPLSGYLQQFRINSRFNQSANPITPRNILCHHSGLPSDINKGMWSTDTTGKMVQQLEQEHVAYPANYIFNYSNIGYSILGEMIEEVSGKPFTTYMADNILNPLGMYHSGYLATPHIRKNLASGYRGGKRIEMLPIRDKPAMSLYTSTIDLSRLMQFLLAQDRRSGQSILMPETIEQMFEVQNEDVLLDLNIQVGLGWFLEYGTIPGVGRIIRHGGNLPGFNSEMILLPDLSLGLVLFTNSGDARRELSQLAERILTLVVREKRDMHPAPSTVQASHDGGEWPSGEEWIETLAGNYATSLGLITIRPEGRKLCACLANSEVDVVPLTNGWFGLREEPLPGTHLAMRTLSKIRMTRRTIGDRDLLIAHTGERELILGERLPDKPLPEEWKDRIGSYEIINPDPEFPFEIDGLNQVNGRLCLTYRMSKLSNKIYRVPLHPISGTTALTAGIGRHRGESVQVVNRDGEEYLRFSGYLARKVK